MQQVRETADKEMALKTIFTAFLVFAAVCTEFGHAVRSVNVCSLPKKSGPCYANFQRYYFNKFTKKCMKFTYGGCNGNANRFKTLEDCQKRCIDICQLPADSGNCYGNFPRYYHNKDTNMCEIFTYGGCDGNANRFDRQELCERKCVPTCSQPKKPGPCLAYFPRYYYDKNSGECKTFGWGGCQNNDNNFLTKSECETECVKSYKDCFGPKVSGPCYASIKRYYYNSVFRKCLQFTWGGCNPGRNNFFTKAECETTCQRIYY